MTTAKMLAAAMTMLLARSTSAQPANNSAKNARGVYLYSLNVAADKSPADAPQVIQALNEPGVDGITLVENWNTIEPSRGVYEWTLALPGQSRFDQWVAAAMSAGRHINLAIRAGEDVPCWLFREASSACGPAYAGSYAGARQWRFEAAAHQGLASSLCEVVDIAAPWDPVFLGEWDSLLAAVAEHLRDVGAYDAVTLVRLTGINRTTDEFRLPEEILPSSCTDSNGNIHPSTNSIATWLDAGYRPSLLLQAWDAITGSFLRSFPDKTFNVPIIPVATGQGQYPFPEIDDNGCVYTAIVPKSKWSVPSSIPGTTCTNDVDIDQANSQLNAVLFDLLEMASNRFPRHLVVEFENIDAPQPANSTVLDAAAQFGTMSAFMTNNYFAAVPGAGAGAACSGGFTDPQACADSDAYLALLNIGIYPCQTNPTATICEAQRFQSTFIEVFAPDMLTFTDAILSAHMELHRSPNAH
jgi:hypothetical protein